MLRLTGESLRADSTMNDVVSRAWNKKTDDASQNKEILNIGEFYFMDEAPLERYQMLPQRSTNTALLVKREDACGWLVTSWSSEEDGLSGRFLLDVRGEALEELRILPLGHGSEDRGRSPTSWVYCGHRGKRWQHDKSQVVRSSEGPWVKVARPWCFIKPNKVT